MITVPWLIVVVTIWFIVLVMLRSALPWKFCAACVAIGSTWLALLLLRSAGARIDPILIAVLMGESVIGLYFFLERRIPDAWQIFRWPYLMTATAVVYYIVGVQFSVVMALSLLLIVWGAFGLLHAVRRLLHLRSIADRLIACCRDW